MNNTVVSNNPRSSIIKNTNYSTYQAAKLLDVDVSTVSKWIDDAKLKGYSTPGGHRRVKGYDLYRFCKK